MQLESHYDAIFVGHNYLSSLSALMMKRAGKKVLIVSDPGIRVGENYFFHFSLLEENFLKAWDRHVGLGLEQFWETSIDKESYLLGWKRAWMNLGAESPSINLLELQRKSSAFLKLESHVSATVFDQDFFHYVQEVATKWAESLLLKNIETLLDTIACPDHLKVMFDTAYEHYLNQVKNNNEVLHFHLFLQSALGSRLQYPMHKVQFIFALIKLISPRRRFLSSSLGELEQLLKIQDILVKEAKVQAWQTKGSGGSLLLDSFDGVVHSKRIIVMGEFGYDSPLSLSENGRQVQLLDSIEFSFTLPMNKAPFTLIDAEQAIAGYSSIMKIYKDELNVWHGIDYIEGEDGDKAKFHLSNLEHRLSSLFYRYFPGVQPPKELIVINGLEKKILFLDFERQQPIKESSLSHDALMLLEELSPGKMRQTSGIQYWGSLKSNSLGLFSLLLETKLTFTNPT
ncbi:MAG: hypothetical protein ACOYL6_08220 [Bacteriovoracaceae bacterium]